MNGNQGSNGPDIKNCKSLLSDGECNSLQEEVWRQQGVMIQWIQIATLAFGSILVYGILRFTKGTETELDPVAKALYEILGEYKSRVALAAGAATGSIFSMIVSSIQTHAITLTAIMAQRAPEDRNWPRVQIKMLRKMNWFAALAYTLIPLLPILFIQLPCLVGFVYFSGKLPGWLPRTALWAILVILLFFQILLFWQSLPGEHIACMENNLKGDEPWWKVRWKRFLNWPRS